MAMRRALFYLSIVAAVGYGGLLIWKASFAVGGSDSSGYANTARLLAAGHIVAPIDGPRLFDLPDRFDRVFIPLAFEPGRQPHTMVPFYPPGFSLHFAAAGMLFGWDHAPYFVSPLAGLVLVIVTYLLAREFSLSRPLAFLAAAILGGSAVLLTQAVQPMSDVVSALWVAAALLFALRSRRTGAWAAVAGAAFGMAVLVRPTNAIALIPLLLALGWRLKTLAIFAAGGLPFAAFEFRWNAVLYGGPFRTGYGGLGDFKLANFPDRFVYYSRTLAQMFSPLVPIGWLSVPGDGRLPLRDRALLVLWFAVYLVLYCLWGPYEAWWYTRYLIPALPALVIGAVLVARDLLRLVPQVETGWLRSPRLALVLAAVLLVVVAGAERRAIRRWDPLGIAEGERIYPLTMDLLRKTLPDRSLVVCMQFSGAVRYYTEFQSVRRDWLASGDFSLLRTRAEAKGYRLFALGAPFELDDTFGKAPGKWKEIGAVRDAKLWELE